MTWDVQSGRWIIVIMNANAAPAITVAASAGAQTDLLVPIAFGLLAIGLALGVIALVLVVTGVRASAEPTLSTAGASASFGPYPARSTG